MCIFQAMSECMYHIEPKSYNNTWLETKSPKLIPIRIAYVLSDESPRLPLMILHGKAVIVRWAPVLNTYLLYWVPSNVYETYMYSDVGIMLHSCSSHKWARVSVFIEHFVIHKQKICEYFATPGTMYLIHGVLYQYWGMGYLTEISWSR